ncbi:hypothetical protein [Salinispira pacifica]|uniref:Uncharacterized protein n=1 Tax=Salinispira pacifica TaxID=1307761 RepID=V5WGJ0_9SPIO|nr:hypothetical protein [Salinispira pacifica]AHC14740.1 hypothetical protein L21SP2_1341 [Salinispira pacifica]
MPKAPGIQAAPRTRKARCAWIFLPGRRAVAIFAAAVLIICSAAGSRAYAAPPVLSAGVERSLTVGSSNELSRGSYGMGARVSFVPEFLEFSPVIALGLPLDLGAGIHLPEPDPVQSITYQKAGAGVQLRFNAFEGFRITVDLQGGAYLRQIRYLLYGEPATTLMVNSYLDAGPGLEFSSRRRQENDPGWFFQLMPGYTLLFARDVNAQHISFRIFSGISW